MSLILIIVAVMTQNNFELQQNYVMSKISKQSQVLNKWFEMLKSNQK